MELVGERHHYPLVANYAQRFSGQRFALLGDAAVGMHPVTAHGFNLGLAGVERLSAAIVGAWHADIDWGSASVLQPYARAQHLPRLVRQAVMAGAQHLPPLKAAIVAQLSGRSPWRILRSQLPRPPFLRD